VSHNNSIRITRSNCNSTSHVINYNQTGPPNADSGLELHAYDVIITWIQTYRDVPGYDTIRVQLFAVSLQFHIQTDLLSCRYIYTVHLTKVSTNHGTCILK
jgi:hypothetical protein